MSEEPREREQNNRVIYSVIEGIDSPQTRKKYAYHFKCFVNHFDGITDESILSKGEKEPRVLEAMIIQWLKHLHNDRHHKYSTIHHEVAAVLHFFKWNDIRLNVEKINRSFPKDEQVTEDRAYTHKEIEQMIAKCNERGRVVILLMGSTGMRIGALPGLKFGDITNIQSHNLYRIQVYARARDSYYTFCTPE